MQISRRKKLDNNTKMEGVDQTEQVENSDRVELDCDEFSENEVETNIGGSNLGNPTQEAGKLMHNPMLTILLNEIRAQNTKFTMLEQKLVENACSMESRIEQKLMENASSLENRLKQDLLGNLGENISSLERRLEQRLEESYKI